MFGGWKEKKGRVRQNTEIRRKKKIQKRVEKEMESEQEVPMKREIGMTNKNDNVMKKKTQNRAKL